MVNLLERMGLDAEAIVEVLKDGKKKMPRRLNPAAFDCATESLTYIHECHRVPRDVYSVIDMAFGSERSAIRHITYDEYLNECQKRQINEQFGNFGRNFESEDDYLAYMWRKYHTPNFNLRK